LLVCHAMCLASHIHFWPFSLTVVTHGLLERSTVCQHNNTCFTLIIFGSLLLHFISSVIPYIFHYICEFTHLIVVWYLAFRSSLDFCDGVDTCLSTLDYYPSLHLLFSVSSLLNFFILQVEENLQCHLLVLFCHSFPSFSPGAY
jgi:hypothetical protein